MRSDKPKIGLLKPIFGLNVTFQAIAGKLTLQKMRYIGNTLVFNQNVIKKTK